MEACAHCNLKDGVITTLRLLFCPRKNYLFYYEIDDYLVNIIFGGYYYGRQQDYD
nr:MAG TPA: hypothetical protein [Caudoviricetes sp.]